MCSDTSAATAIATVHIDNARTRVTEWRFPVKGASTGWHRHEYDYVVVPLFDGVLNIDTGAGNITSAELQHGVPYFRETGVEHNVINGNEFECAFVEIEFLDRPAAPQTSQTEPANG